MPRDLGSWGFWLSILALIAAYPLNLLANLTSPRLQNWWATRPARSRASLQKTIAELESKLAEMQRREPITDVESFILSRLARLEQLQNRSDYVTMVCFIAFTALALSIVNALKIPLTHFNRVMVGIFGVWLFVVSIMNIVALFTRVKYYELFRVPQDERRLKAVIEIFRRQLRAKSE
ncbi:MAG: hypothetical protein WA197_23075 [Candidatus Acidiferrales bacterium]